MKKFIPILTLALLATPFALRAEENAPAAKPAEKTTEAPAKPGKFKWYTSIKAARKAAAEEKKPIIMLFTGSDWCPWCVKLEKEILSQKNFKEWAAGHAILYMADFPNGKPKIDEAGNRKLMKEYGASGFPSIIVTDSSGKKLGKTGYQKMKPAEYTKHLESIIGGKGA